MRRTLVLCVTLVLLLGAVPLLAQDRVYSDYASVEVTTPAAPEPEPDPPFLPAPHGVQADAVDHETVVVTWEPVEGASGYEADCGGEVADTVETTVTFGGLEADTDYTCRVRAYADPEPDPDPEPAGDWQEAWASGDLERVRGLLASPTTGDLTVHSGQFSTTSHGQVVENLRIVNGTISVRHNNVTIRNVVLEQSACGACYGIAYSPTWDHNLSGLTVESTTIQGPRSEVGSTYAILAYGDMVIRNVHIHGHKSGIGTFGDGPVTMERVLIDDNFYYDGLHSSGIALRGGNVTLTESFVEGGATAPFFIYAEMSNVLVERSLFHEPGSSYCMGLGSHVNATHVRVHDSAFGACGFGAVTFRNLNLEGNEWSGNFWFSSGEPVG